MTGIQSGILAFVLWGLVPLFWKQLNGHNPWELVAHRAAWSFPLLLGVVLSQRKTKPFLAALQMPKLWGTTLLLTANWLLYIWLTINGRFVEASLGYFIVPLLNTLLGVAFLGERLRPLQKISIALAGVALLFPLLGDLRYFPWAALAIAFLWSFYGFVRKGLGVEGTVALAAETAVAFPLALGYLLWKHAALGTPREALLLVGTGPITVGPLLLFGHAVTRVPLSTLGLLQYLGPTITFICGQLIAPEPIPWHRAALLGTVWLAIIVYIYDSIKNRPVK
ncbi:EamA family transporter RarD [Armatimonas sp.]|uniref:EamA family transporter RarD n=1 Tax=Armatimonas sp. TaxID=1872638 RepID=UPI00286C9287|nr:EamA family transporter RarD [Armatimonas sp.]